MRVRVPPSVRKITLFKMFYVYVLRSVARNYIYVGLTGNVQNRFEQHNLGLNRTTRAYRPFELIRIETFLLGRQLAIEKNILNPGLAKNS